MLLSFLVFSSDILLHRSNEGEQIISSMFIIDSVHCSGRSQYVATLDPGFPGGGRHP